MNYKDKYTQIGGKNINKKDLQFILFGNVMTGHQVWFHF
jgi:hypothetical protein